jgi:N-ethylmaleimide reductase
MSTPEPQKLFTPVQIGDITLKHRVVMAPLTRLRATLPGGVPSDLMLEYYRQRASEGGLIVTESTAIAQSGHGYYGAPGIYNAAQVSGWKRIVETVHAYGGRIFAQLWHAGRCSHTSVTQSTPISASVDATYWTDEINMVSTTEGFQLPSPHRALQTHEIPELVEQYRSAAANAKYAGFDGVELMAGNGHLMDQFLQDISNKRTDDYGGSIENRARLLIEVVNAMASVWGPGRVGVRIAPSGTFNGMGDSDPKSLFRHLASRLNVIGLAYLHVIEPRIKGGETLIEGQDPIAARDLCRYFKGPIIAAGGFEPSTAEASIAGGDANLVAFGRHFIANPDLPKRIERGFPLNPYDRNTFYAFDERGYTDYPFYDQS